MPQFAVLTYRRAIVNTSMVSCSIKVLKRCERGFKTIFRITMNNFYDVYDSCGQLVRGNFPSYHKAFNFCFINQRYDWNIRKRE